MAAAKRRKENRREMSDIRHNTFSPFNAVAISVIVPGWKASESAKHEFSHGTAHREIGHLKMLINWETRRKSGEQQSIVHKSLLAFSKHAHKLF